MSPLAPEAASTRRSFLHNVIWGWLGVGVNLVIGIVLSPIIIRKLGVEQYGLWVLLFSLLDYMRVLDFGFRAAVVNACARCRTREDWVGVNRTVVTALAYFAAAGAGCLLLVAVFRRVLIEGADVSPALSSVADPLIILIALAVVIRLVSSPLTAALEAFQRFDLVNRAYIGSLLFRSSLSLTVLLMGYGLVAMAWIVLTAQVGESVYTWIRARQVVPSLRLGVSGISSEAFAGLFRYGRYAAVIAASNLVAINAPVTVLGYVRGAAEVGFFALPFRLLMYAAEALAKVSDVTSSVTAALDEAGDRQRIWRLAVTTNRNCFGLFAPLAIFLLAYGTPLLALWVTPEVAANSGALIPIMLLNFGFAVAGQYNAGAVLIGQGKHARFAYGTVVEAGAMIVLLWLFVPEHGAIGAAAAVATTVVASRCLYVAYLVCRLNGFSLARYLRHIYLPGLLTGLPFLLGAFALRTYVWPGYAWPQLGGAAVLIAGSYFAAAWFTVLDADDRRRILTLVGRG